MPQAQAVSIPPIWRERSAGSLAFETLWRSLPKKGLIPDRKSFEPACAKPFLQSMVLVEAPSAERPWLMFRLAGDVVGERTARNVTGTDYLDYLPKEQHAEALAAARLVSEHPCGIWQLTPVIYERGFSQLVEVTTFPLGPGADGIPLLLGYLTFHYGPSDFLLIPTDRAVAAETSRIFEFIDIGAGVPAFTGV